MRFYEEYPSLVLMWISAAIFFLLLAWTVAN